MRRNLLVAGWAVAGLTVANAGTAASDPSGGLGALLWPHGTAESRRDASGSALSGDALRDRLTVVSFVSAGCTVLCVTRIMDLDRLARTLPDTLRGRVVFLAVDTDPAADDAGRLRTFAESVVGPHSPLRFLTSDEAATKALAGKLGYPAASLPEPPSTILLFDRRGRMAMSYGGDPVDAARLQRDIAILDTFTEGLDGPPPAAPAGANAAR